MLVLADFGKPYVIDSLTSPVAIRHHWIFNAQMTDFMLQQITYLEETTGAAVKLRVNNSEFWVPATWYILVTDRDTYQLDTISVQACSSTKHIAFIFAPDEMNLRTLDIDVVDYVEDISLVHPMINKGSALVHPVGPGQGVGKTLQLSVVMGPHDLYKHLTNKVVGDVTGW
jgi:hypothetical protein